MIAFYFNPKSTAKSKPEDTNLIEKYFSKYNNMATWILIEN